MHNVLKSCHAMMGADIHLGNPVPPAVAPLPHLVGATLKWLPGFGNKDVSDVLTGGGWATMARATNIGPAIPHAIIPPHALLAVIWPTSGSKCHFGAGSVLTDQGPVAASLKNTETLCLNCGLPPTPGSVLPWNTHVVGMTQADIDYGTNQMLLDFAVEFAVGFVFGPSPVGDWLGKLSGRLFAASLSRLAPKAVEEGAKRTIGQAVTEVGKSAVRDGLIPQAVPTVLSLWVGTPVSFSSPLNALDNPVFSVYEYLTGSLLGEYPSAPPDSRQ